MDEGQLKINIRTLTKAKFLEYARQRKALDSGFEKVIVNRFEEKTKAQRERTIARSKTRKEKLERDPEYKKLVKEKAHDAYLKRKEKLLAEQLQRKSEQVNEEVKVRDVKPDVKGDSEPDSEEEVEVARAPEVRQIIHDFGRFNFI
jgi:hypothetical protein